LKNFTDYSFSFFSAFYAAIFLNRKGTQKHGAAQRLLMVFESGVLMFLANSNQNDERIAR